MASEDDRRLPSATTGDAAHAFVKGALAAIPIAGGVASELFALALAPPLAKRRDVWLESLAQELRRLRIDFESLGRNEAFVTAVVHATQVAQRTHHREKLDALRNAVVNCASGCTLDDDLRSLFLNFVDELTPTHLRILRLLENRGSDLPLLRKLMEERHITDQMVLGLLGNGLIVDPRPLAARGRDTGESLLTFSWTVSRLGRDFLAFISSTGKNS